MRDPIKMKHVVTTEYWDCGCCELKHKTRDGALKCIEKKLKKESEVARLASEDRYGIVVSVINGCGLKKTAREHGCTVHRLKKILRDFRDHYAPDYFIDGVFQDTIWHAYWEDSCLSGLRKNKEDWLDRAWMFYREGRDES